MPLDEATIDIVTDLNDGTPAEPVLPSTPASAEPEKPASIRETISNALKGEPHTPGSVIEREAENPPGIQTDQQGNTGGDNPPVAAVQAPEGIDPQQFSQLPAEMQQTVARTMEFARQREQQYQQLLPVEQLIAPRVQAWALNGMTPAQAVNQLFALSDMATSDPEGFVKYFAQQQGLDLYALADDTYDNPEMTPEMKAMQDELREVRQQLAVRTQNEQQAAHNSIIQEVISFSEEKNPDGTLKRPYFAEMGESVMPFIQAAIQQTPNKPRAQVLQEAYEQACWALPAFRGKMLEAQRVAAEAEQLRQNRARAAQAQAAGTSLSPGNPVSETDHVDVSKLSLRDTIKRAMAGETA